MAKTIVTQFGEYLNYANIVKSGIITPDYEMIATDNCGNKIPMGIYAKPDEAEQALKDLHDWLSAEAYAVYEITGGEL